MSTASTQPDPLSEGKFPLEPVDDIRIIRLTTDITLEQIANEAPTAVQLLSLCAFLGPEDIPRRLLLSGSNAVPESCRPPIRDSRALIDAVGPLSRFGLLNVEGNALKMHRVHQAVMRERLPLRERETWATAAAQIVLHSFPPDPEPTETWAWSGRLLPHAARTIDHLESLGIEPLLLVELRLRTGRYLTYQGKLGAAEATLRLALKRVVRIEQGGPLHATVLNQLAVVERELGRFNRAKVRATEALRLHSLHRASTDGSHQLPEMGEVAAGARDALRATGEQLTPDSNVAGDLRNLGTIAHRQGDLDLSESYYLQALEMLSALYGAEDIALAPLLDNAVELLFERERWREALRLLQRTLDTREANGQGNSPEAMSSRILLKVLAQPDLAAASATELIEHLEREYGPLHPEVAAGELLLGTILRRIGDFGASRVRITRAIEIFAVNYGSKHYRVAQGLMGLVGLAVDEGDSFEAERRLREGIGVVMSAPAGEREAAVRLSGLGGELSEAVASDRSRSFVHSVVDIVAAAAGGDAEVLDATREMVIRAQRIGGDLLLRTGESIKAASEYAYGLELARLTTDTALDDSEFLMRLGFLAAADGDVQTALECFRACMECMRNAQIRSPIWVLIDQCGSLVTLTGSIADVRPVLDQLFDEVKEKGAMTEFRGLITAVVPDGWFAKESMTLLSPDGQSNVIASSEPLDPSTDTDQYAGVQGELLENEFPEYVQKSFERIPVFSDRDGYLRTFEWTPPDGRRVAQAQLYYAEPGRGYTCTATTTADNLAAVELVLLQVMRNLRLQRA